MLKMTLATCLVFVATLSARADLDVQRLHGGFDEGDRVEWQKVGDTWVGKSDERIDISISPQRATASIKQTLGLHATDPIEYCAALFIRAETSRDLRADEAMPPQAFELMDLLKAQYKAHFRAIEKGSAIRYEDSVDTERATHTIRTEGPAADVPRRDVTVCTVVPK